MAIGEIKFLLEQARQIRAEESFNQIGVNAVAAGTVSKEASAEITGRLREDLELKPIVLKPKVSSRQEQMEFAAAIRSSRPPVAR